MNDYYVSVQLVNKKGATLGAPHFVHVNGDKRKTQIRGLKPRALYQMKVVTGLECKIGCNHAYIRSIQVIAYSGKKQKSSPSVKVKTKGLGKML